MSITITMEMVKKMMVYSCKYYTFFFQKELISIHSPIKQKQVL